MCYFLQIRYLNNIYLFRVIGLKVDSTNIALPPSLHFEDDQGQLVFTVYVQVGDGFLSKQQLLSALSVRRVISDCNWYLHH